MVMNVPQSWKDIKLSQFENALKAEQGEFDSDLERQLAWLAAVTQTDVDDLEKLPLKEITGVAKQLAWIKKPSFNERIPAFFICGGKMFRTFYRIETINAAQWIELNTFMKGDAMFALDKIMATVTTEIKWYQFKPKYDADKHAERAAHFRKHLSLAVIYPLALFFFHLYIKSAVSIEVYLGKQIRDMNLQLISDLEKQMISS